MEPQIFSVHVRSDSDRVANVSMIWWLSPSSAPTSGPMSLMLIPGLPLP
jgi:hypothetical protein